MSLTVAVEVPPRDREVLVVVDCGRRRFGRVWRSGPGSCCWPRTAWAPPRSCVGSGCQQADGDRLEAALRRRGDRWAGGPAEAGPAADDRRGRGRGSRRWSRRRERLGVTHWSTPAAGRQLGISNFTVARRGRSGACSRGGCETFKFSTDPELEAKIRDVVGLYLNPPDKAVVLCVDEKSQVQALDRTAPVLPMRPGLPEKQTHDYVRHGTTTLFAALEVATGKVTDACYPRHRHQEFLRFLKQVAKAYPRGKLHMVVDNYATHKHPTVRPGWPATRGSRCTSPRPRGPGSTWSRSSSRSSPGRPSAAAPSPPSRPHRRDRDLHRRLERPRPPPP